jgi:hypothetical protein
LLNFIEAGSTLHNSTVLVVTATIPLPSQAFFNSERAKGNASNAETSYYGIERATLQWHVILVLVL